MKRVARKRWQIGIAPLYIILSTVMIVVFLSVCALIQYNYTHGEITNYITEMDRVGLGQLSENLDAEIGVMNHYMESYIASGEIADLLEQASDLNLSAYEQNEILQEMSMYVSRKAISFSEFAYIEISIPTMLMSSADTSRSNGATYYDRLQTPYIQRQLDESENQMAFFPPGVLDGWSERQAVFIGRLGQYGGQDAYLIFRMREGWLTNLLHLDQADSYLYRSDGYIYPQASEEILTHLQERVSDYSGTFFQQIQGEHYSISYYEIQAIPFTVVSIQNNTDIFAPLNQMQRIMLVAVLVSIAFSAVFFMIYIRRKVADLRTLLKSAREYMRSGIGSILPMKYRTRSLREDTTLSLFMMVALTLLVFEIIFSSFSLQILQQSSQALAGINLDRKVTRLDALVTRNNITSANIIFDKTMQDILWNKKRGEEWSKETLMETVTANVHDASLQFVDIYDANGHLFYTSRLNDSDAEPEIAQEVRESYGEPIFISKGTRNGQLTFTRRIRNVYNNFNAGMVTLGYMTSTYSGDSLTLMLGSAENELNNLFILSEDGTVVYSYTDADQEIRDLASGWAGQVGNEGTLRSNAGDEYQVMSRPFTGIEWTAVSLLPREDIWNSYGQFISFNMNLLLLFWLLGFVFSRVFANYIVRPVQRLIERILEGEIATGQEAGGYYPNEFNELTHAFNQMTAQLHTVYDLETERNKAELSALQAQINPHFMYNTFESIRWMNKMGDSHSVEMMIENLSDLFRLGISAEKNWLSVEEELRYAKAYMSIQKMRYEDQLHYRWEIQEETNEIIIPKLILQPLLENSIYHGIRQLTDHSGLIVIRTLISGENLMIQVSDNGPGFSPEEIQVQKKLFVNPQDNPHGSIGLNNVYRRLMFSYGERFTMEIDSVPYESTIISITLPME